MVQVVLEQGKARQLKLAVALLLWQRVVTGCLVQQLRQVAAVRRSLIWRSWSSEPVIRACLLVVTETAGSACSVTGLGKQQVPEASTSMRQAVTTTY